LFIKIEYSNKLIKSVIKSLCKTSKYLAFLIFKGEDSSIVVYALYRKSRTKDTKSITINSKMKGDISR